VEESQAHVSSVENLTGRFESSNYIDKKLLMFHEVPLSSTSGRQTTSLNKILSLTGDKTQRSEKKYGDVVTYAVNFLVVLASN